MDRNAPRLFLERIASGDRAAFSDLYDATSAKLFGVALRILHDHGEAQEALQDCYLNVWRRAGSFDAARASAMTWLIAIARNAAIDRARRRRMPVADLAEADEIEDDLPSPEAAAQSSDEARQLHDCLKELPKNDAYLLRRAFMDGLSYSQVAESQSRPLGTVKSTIRRALAKLRTCLE